MKKFFNNISKPAKVSILLDPSPSIPATHNKITVNDPHDQFVEQPGQSQVFSLYDKDDPISGKINIKPEKPFEHQGIKIELIGEISFDFFFKFFLN